MKDDVIIARISMMTVRPPAAVRDVDFDVAAADIPFAGADYRLAEIGTRGAAEPAGKNDVDPGVPGSFAVEASRLPYPPYKCFFDIR